MKSSELNYILHTCGNIYKPLEIEPKNYDIRKVIKIAYENELLHYLVENDPTIYQNLDYNLKLVVNESLTLYQQYFCRLNKTLSEIDKILGQNSYLVIKTIYNYPRITKDVDIVVRDLSNSLKSFLENGYKHTFKEPPISKQF
jgi:hypothetical protein